MIQMFATFSQETLTEIFDAAIVADEKKNNNNNNNNNQNQNQNKDLSRGPIDLEKLRSKAVQFFPNMEISTAELTNAAGVGPTASDALRKLMSAKLESVLTEKRSVRD